MSVEKSPLQKDHAKLPYQAPKLITYGLLRNLTQNGTGATSESMGSKLCGPTYNTKGGSNC